VCKFSSDCGPDKVCADGQCLAACSPTTACANGANCEKGVCKPLPISVVKCSGDPECGDGKYCNQGVCAVDTRPKPNCSGDAQCSAANQKCVEGYCKYTCSSDQQCRVIDARIGYCGKDQVCRTQSEANAECTTKDQCTDGKDCIDNACK
jgi:hypothetical protein